VENPELSKPKKVGKLEAPKFFEDVAESKTSCAKKEYVPVVIDKDAFERTMCR
jgi:hypothetical protein